MTDVEIMSIALEEAQKSLSKGLLPVGAVLVVDGEIVGKAHKQDNHSYHLDHAEILLVRDFFKGKNIRRKDHEISIYTTLEPCMMCLGTIMHLPISRLVYAANDPFGGGVCMLDQDNLPCRHRHSVPKVLANICEAEAKEFMKEYLKITTLAFLQDPENPFVKYIYSV